MSGKNPRLSVLAARKQLLIAESELNRVHLVNEWQTMAEEAHSFANQAKTIAAITSAVAALAAGLSSFRRKKSTPAAEKPAWWRTILKGAGMLSSFWAELRPNAR